MFFKYHYIKNKHCLTFVRIQPNHRQLLLLRGSALSAALSRKDTGNCVVGPFLDEGGTLAWPRAGSLRRMIGQHIEQVLNGVDEIHVHEGERGLLITDLLISGAQGRRPVGGERQRRRLVRLRCVYCSSGGTAAAASSLAGLRILGPVDVIKSVLKIQRQRSLC